MSESNGSAPGTVESITRPSVTGGYRPAVWIGSRLGQILDGRPRFTWLEAERMRWDSMVQFGLHVLRAPLWGVTWKVHADNEKAEKWIQREFDQIYRKILPHALRIYEYGVACGELIFHSKRIGRDRRIHFREMLEIHPRDAKPFIYDRGKRSGQLAAMEVGNVANGRVILDRQHSFWFKGESEFGEWWGRPRLATAYEPWLEKRGRHGAVDARRLWFMKCGFSGPKIFYPIGTVDMGIPGQPNIKNNQDVARELVEKYERGGVLALPSATDDKGNALWRWEDPKSFADVDGVLDYPKALDKEIFQGLGIPPELVEASTVGSGYSGRAIPAQVFFSMMDEIAGLLVGAIDTQIMRQLVRWNFGRVGYTIVPDSLAKLMAAQGPGGTPAGAGAPGQPPAAGAQPGGGVPYQGTRGGVGMKDPRTGRVHYQGKGPQHAPIRLSFKAEQKLAKKRRKNRCERIRMSWRDYGPSKNGVQRWISDRGEVRYQAASPNEESMQGPESLYHAPDYAHLPREGVIKPDVAERMADFVQEEHPEADRADIHRRAAGHLENALQKRADQKSKGPIQSGVELSHAYLKAKGDLDSAKRSYNGDNEEELSAAKRAQIARQAPALAVLNGEYQHASPIARSHIDAAMFNADGGDTAKIARRLTSEWLDMADKKMHPGDLAVFEKAMMAHGLEPIGNPGDEVKFSGEYHQSGPGAFTGDRHEIIRPGWTMKRPGNEYIVAKAITKAAAPAAKHADIKFDHSRLVDEVKAQHARTKVLNGDDWALSAQTDKFDGYQFSPSVLPDAGKKNAAVVEAVGHLGDLISGFAGLQPPIKPQDPNVKFDTDTGTTEDLRKQFGVWSHAKRKETTGTHLKAQNESKVYREQLHAHLKHTKAAADEVMQLPEGTITAETRSDARIVAAHAEKLLARLQRKVQMSFTDPLWKVWASCAGPVCVAA